MALIICPECEREISEEAITCPGCGYNIRRHRIEEQKNLKKENSNLGKNGMNIIPTLMGILFLLPPILYFLAFGIRILEQFIRHKELFFGDFRYFGIDLLKAIGISVIFLIISIGWFVIRKTKIPAFIGFCIISIAMLGCSISGIKDLIIDFVRTGKYMDFYVFISLITLAMEKINYAVMFIAMLLFAIVVIKSFDVKVLGAIGCLMMTVSFAFFEVLLIIYRIERGIFMPDKYIILRLISAFGYDVYFVSIVLVCLLTFLIFRKSIRNIFVKNEK